MASVIIDTNIVMHYKWLGDYSWDRHIELNDEEITIILTTPVVEELDKHKDTHKSGNMRSRCRKFLAWLEDNLSKEYKEVTELKKGLSIKLDLKTYTNHSAQSPDDRIIEYAREHPEPVYLVSNDVPIRLKARSYGIAAIEPIPSERITDEEETEVQNLRKRIQALENRNPDLTLVPENNNILYSQNKLTIEPETYIFNQLSKHTRGMNLRRDGILSENTYQSYDPLNRYDTEEVIKFKNELSSCLHASLDLASILSISPLVELVISNKGTSFATDVEITITAPHYCQIFVMSREAYPKLPTRPRSMLETLSSISIRDEHYALRKSAGSKSEPKIPDYTSKDHTLQWRTDKIPIDTSISLPIFYLKRDGNSPTNFGIETRIICNELNRPIKMSLPISISEKPDFKNVSTAENMLHKHFALEEDVD